MEATRWPNSPDPTRDTTTAVDAVGKATEALEYVERARGHLYAFHQLIGRADYPFEQSALGLAAAGRHSEAASLWRNVVGLPKYVASHTLTVTPWSPSTILRGDIATQVAQLKARPGREL